MSHFILAMAALAVSTADDSTWSLSVSVDGVCCAICVQRVETALAHLDGVKSAKQDPETGLFVMKVLEEKSLLPGAVKDKIVEMDFKFRGVTIEVAGTAEKAGEGWVLVARGSGQKYELKPNDEFKKLAEAGKTSLVITGAVTQEKERDGKKPLPVIEVKGARETK